MNGLKSQIGWLISKALYEWNPVKRRRKKSFYEQFVKAGDLCFDIGAHLGDRTQTWLELGASVLAIEPQPRFADYLRKKFAGNAKFHFEQIGIGSQVGSMEMMISNMYPTLSTLAGQQWVDDMKKAAPMKIDFDEKVEVAVDTLDRMIEKYGKPAFCKIDVEGFEDQVLKGLGQQIPVLSFEFLSFNEDNLKECLDILTALGYVQFNWSYQESFKFQLAEWTTMPLLFDNIVNFKEGTYSGDVYAKIAV